MRSRKSLWMMPHPSKLEKLASRSSANGVLRPESHWSPYNDYGDIIAYFWPRLSFTGNYEIFIWYPDDPNADHATNMPVTIHHGKNAGQSTTKYVDLTQNTGQWNSLGIYVLYKGKKSFIEARNEVDGNVLADAYKFVLL